MRLDSPSFVERTKDRGNFFMSKITSWLKRIQIRQILTVFFAGIFLFVSTACSAESQATSPGSDEIPKETKGAPESNISESEAKGEPAGEIREDVPKTGDTAPYKGGMNKYTEVDPRKDASAAQEKAEELEENAERKAIDMTGDVGDNTQRTLDRKAENLQRSDRKQEQALEAAQEKAQSTAENLVEGTQEAAEDVVESSQRALDDTSDALQDQTSETVKGTKRALEDTADELQDQTSETVKGTKRALEDTADAVN